MNKIKLNNVRLAFPALFQKASYKGNTGKFGATFLIPKTDKQSIDQIRAEMKAILARQSLTLSADRICLKDGDEKSYLGYAEHYSLKSVSNRRPYTFNKDMSAVKEEDDILYPGCYVNALIDFWLQDNDYGKRISSNLYVVQFAEHGERFVRKEDSEEDILSQFSPSSPSGEKPSESASADASASASEYDDDLPF